VGTLRGDGGKRALLAGQQALGFRRDGMEVGGGGGGGGGVAASVGGDAGARLTPAAPPPSQIEPAFAPDGSYANWDAIGALWEHAFT